MAATFIAFDGRPESEHRRIGTVTLSCEHTFTCHYATASWFQDVVVAAGTTGALTCNGLIASVTFHGSKGRSNLTPEPPAQTPLRDEGIGEPATIKVSKFAGGVAEAIQAGAFLAAATVVLDPDVQVLSEVRPIPTNPSAQYPHWGFAVAT